MSLGFDLSVNNYSTDDLLSLLGLGSNPSIPEVNNKLNIFIDMFTGISGENSELVVKFFKDIGEYFNNYYENTVVEDSNYYNYTQNFQANNGATATLPFPMLSSNKNDLHSEELVECRDVEVEERDNDTLIPNNLTYTDIHQYTEFSLTNRVDVFGVPERTVFKYSFDTVNNVTSIQLSEISIPIPYTISDYKNNNKFKIIDNNSSTEYIINLGNYYLLGNDSLTSFIEYLNKNYFYLYPTASGILSKIIVSTISSDGTRNKLKFELQSDPSYSTFTLSFDVSYNSTNCIDIYKLNKILGFSELSYTSDLTTRSITGNSIIFKQTKFYVSVDDNQVNYNQSLVLVGSSILTNYVLGTISLPATDLYANNHVLFNQLLTNTISSSSRSYFGPVNLDSFTIKFYDVNGIVQQLPEETLFSENFYFSIRYVKLNPNNSQFTQNGNHRDSGNIADLLNPPSNIINN